MFFESIQPCLAATLTVADMLSQLESCPNKNARAVRHVVAVVSRRMLDQHRHVGRDELERCSNLVAWLYLG